MMAPSLLAQRRARVAPLSVSTPTRHLEAESDAFSKAYEFRSEVLGQGAFAVVKRAIRKGHEYEEVAVKVTNLFGDEELCKTARTEFELLRSCSHPGIVKALDFFVSAGSLKSYLCMELVSGTTLSALVSDRGPIPECTAKPFFEQMFSAILHLHGNSMAHRDIKPDNLMVDITAQRLQICDFNCARRLSDGSLLSPRVGTAAFAAPELLLGQCEKGEPLDIWGAGLCLYFALSGGATILSSAGGSLKRPEAYGKYMSGMTNSEWKALIMRAGVCWGSLVAAVLTGCLEREPTQRLNAVQLSSHPWLSVAELEAPRFRIQPEMSLHLCHAIHERCALSETSECSTSAWSLSSILEGMLERGDEDSEMSDFDGFVLL